VFLGHRRLSIIDLSERGTQPLYNEDRTVAVVCNGELYGYHELRDELIGRGHRFLSDSDSEIFVHAYEQWGPGAWAHFNGIFAAALYDNRAGKVFLVRDHLGVKPLFYLPMRDSLAFASEAKAFLRLPRELWTPSLNLDAAAELMDMPYMLDPEATLLQGVRMLPPAGVLEVDVRTGAFTPPRRFWRLGYDPKVEALGWPAACAAVEEALLRSVRKQMIADAPVGILLSGGLDSSTVAALAQKQSPRPVRTFTAVFEHGLDERTYARAVADHIGSHHTQVPIDPGEVNRRFEEILLYYDDLRSVDGGLFSLYLIGEKIRQTDIKVLLFGEGSDEIFGGYSWYGLSLKPFCWLPPFCRSAIHHYAVSRTFLRASNWRHTAGFHALCCAYGERDVFRQVARMEIEHQLPNHFLMKVDKATMAHGLEGRVPFLDPDLVTLAFSLQRRFKYTGEWFSFSRPDEKHILKAVARPYLPEVTTARKKQGFLIPMSEVLKSNLGKVRDYVMAPGSVSRQLLPARKLEGLFDYRTSLYSPLHKEKEFLLWRCFMLDVWAKVYGLN
jgi:asparagine synthase (glutamine-hydrolysing)